MTTPSYDASAPPVPERPNEPIQVQYHQIFRLGHWGANGWWRIAVGVPSGVLGALVVQSLPVVVWILGLAATGTSSDRAMDLASGKPATPTFLATVNLGWALTIPLVLGLAFLLHGLRPGWVASVAGRMRWRWMGTCFGIAAIALVATVAVSAVLPQGGDGTGDLGGGLNAFTSQTRDYLLIILLLTPLQAAGEEFAFRGYFTQAFGGLFSHFDPRISRTVAVVVPALLFATAHGLGQDLPIFFDRFAFGLVAGILVITTGGLEAGIAMHVLNNFLAFGLALAYSDMTSALSPTDGTWWSIPSTLTQSLVYLGLATWLARKKGIQTRTTPWFWWAPTPACKVSPRARPTRKRG